MANKANSLSHTKWLCKYHIVFTPKYRRKIIYAQYRESLIEIFQRLCKFKGVEIIELDDDPIQFIKNVLSPAKLQSVKVSQKQSGEKIATVTADNTNKRIAIGKNGINIERAKLLANRQHNIDNIILK